MAGERRVRVAAQTCIGSGICVATAPDHFRFSGGVAVPRAGAPIPPNGGDDPVVDAAAMCPVGAISVAVEPG